MFKIMKKQMTVLLLFVLSLAQYSCDKQQKEVNTDELISSANELDRNFSEAYNQGDLEKIMSLYWNSPDLYSYMPGNMVTHGFEETKQSFMEDFKNNAGAKLELHDIKNTVYGDAVVGHGTFTWTLAIEGQEPIVSKGRYTDVKTMKDGKMVYVIDHASVPMMPPSDLEAPAAEKK
jgi:ketosteroid isomerase-like protein